MPTDIWFFAESSRRSQAGRLTRKLALALLVAATLTTGVIANDQEVRREYDYSREAGKEILTATYDGGLLAWITTFRLYGDGRLQITLASPAGEKRVWAEHSVHLSEVEIDHLLSPIVNSGVMELDYKKKSGELRKQGRLVPIAQDAPTFVLTLNLEHYFGPSQPTGGPATHAVSVHALHMIPEYLGDVPDLLALAELEQSLTTYYHKAKALDKEAAP
ncbi:MAG: hypothetical protein HC897_19670 [Thermoanaerobaculia bacterium]|nr:hypothetical protein [Thermoanaerobaculia bacterium]